jgi:tetratricopeptide (TPR) repeat protein
VEQVQTDQEHLRELIAVLDAQLDSRGAEPDWDQVRDLLLRANPTQRELAFQNTKRARRAPGADEPALRRTIPVFRALTEADPDRYTYRAELGAALADIGEYQEAITALDKAIEMRGKSSRFDWFEFHRARARIGLVPGAATPDEQTASALRADLTVAWQKASFRNYVTQILTTHAPSDPEYQTLNRLRPYLPTRPPDPA